MPLELAALLAAIETSKTLVRAGAKVVTEIRGGLGTGGNVKAKKAELETKLQELEEQLTNVGTVGEYIESYFRTSENVASLLAWTGELVQFVNDARGTLEDSRAASYSRDWERISSRYRLIGEESDAPQRVMLERAEWYDERDRIQISGKLKEFSAAYERAKGYVAGRDGDGVLSELEQMARPLRDAQTLIASTLYDQILPSLQRLRA